MGSLVDFHCHLDLYGDFEALVSECDRLGIYTLAVTTTPMAWPRNRDLAAPTKHVRAALGLHPQLAGEAWREIEILERSLHEARYVGEVGLDAGPRFFRSLDTQKMVFQRVLQACAAHGGKILSIHSVRTATLVLDMIEEHLPNERGTPVLHWFTGTQAEAQRAVALGCYFSVNGQMLRSERGRNLTASLPYDRILTETDGPFVTDATGVPLRPAAVADTAKKLAKLKGWSVHECLGILTGNLRQLTAAPE